MSTYQAIHIMMSAAMFTVSLISLIIALIKTITKGKNKQSPCAARRVIV